MGTTRILASTIVADQPTTNLNIYPKELLEEAIKYFNARIANKPSLGGLLDPEAIGCIGEPTHRTKRLFLNDSGVLCAEIETLDTDAGRRLEDALNRDTQVAARPIMCVPAYIDEAKNTSKTDPLEISKIYSIVRVQVEHDEHPTNH